MEIEIIEETSDLGTKNIVNFKVNNQLLWTTDQERDLSVHMILFGYLWRLENYSPDTILVDDYLFCTNPSDFGKMISDISRTRIDSNGNSIRELPDPEELKDITIKPMSELRVEFPNIDFELDKKLNDLIHNYYYGNKNNT